MSFYPIALSTLSSGSLSQNGVLLLSHVCWMAWIHSSNQSETQALMAFWGSHPDYNALKTTTTAMYRTHWQNILPTFEPSIHTPIAPLYSGIANSPIFYPIATEDITWNQGRLNLSSALKDSQDPLSLGERKRRPEITNNMNKSMNAADHSFLKCDLQTTSIKITWKLIRNAESQAPQQT